MAKTESQKDQSARFEKAIIDMVDAGELNPIEADAAFELLMERVKVEKFEGNPDSP